MHVVRHSGVTCGTILYESKNVKTWSDAYITKLNSDKIAAKADHAVLSAYKLPAGCQQLAVRQGIIIASPARMLAVAELLRGHIVQTASLRIVGKERDNKTVALYAYMTSERFWQHLDAIDTVAADLADVDTTERAAHERLWNKRAKLIKAAQKSQSSMRAEIDQILGMAGE